ncbi:hypothetical protein MRX96_052928 [Rhipicephalus microplus]
MRRTIRVQRNPQAAVVASKNNATAADPCSSFSASWERATSAADCIVVVFVASARIHPPPVFGESECVPPFASSAHLFVDALICMARRRHQPTTGTQPAGYKALGRRGAQRGSDCERIKNNKKKGATFDGT